MLIHVPLKFLLSDKFDVCNVSSAFALLSRILFPYSSRIPFYYRAFLSRRKIIRAYGKVFNAQMCDHVCVCVCRWAQVFTDGRMPLECGTGQRLILTNVTYEQQGQYICLASNKINGNVREVKSDPVSLQVVGAPRVRRAGGLRPRERWKSFAANQNYSGIERGRGERTARRWRIAFSDGSPRKNIASLPLRNSGSLNISRARNAGISANIFVAPRRSSSMSLAFDLDWPDVILRWKLAGHGL